MLDKRRMRETVRARKVSELGSRRLEWPAGGDAVGRPETGRRGGAGGGVRAAVVIMDEPTAAFGVKESAVVLDLILDVRKRGLPMVLISHNMPHVFEVADRIHIHRLGRRLTVIDPKKQSMSDAVAMMTGAMAPPTEMAA